MKIAMVCFAGATDAPEGVPPAGRVPELATALVDQGHDVAVYVRKGASGAGREPTMGGARVVPLPAGPAVGLTEAEAMPHAGPYAELLRDALGRQRPDVVHSHGWLAGLVTLLAGGEDHPPVAHTFHRRARLLPRPRFKVGRAVMNRCRAERAIARRADQLIASSLDEQLSLLRIGVPRARVSLVPPGVDCGELSSDGIREPHEGRFRLVIFSRSGRADSGVEAAVRALAALPDTELVIAPEPPGSPWPADETERTRRLADRLRVADRVRLEHGMDQARRRALVRSADAVLCLSTPGGHGAVLEAMACAEPVITSPDADPLGAVIDGVTGVHVNPSDPKHLALAARQLLDNPALRQGMGLAGRDRAVHRYGWPHIAAETGRLYRELVDRPAPARAVAAEAAT